MSLEPAIPQHLFQERTQASNLPADYAPAYPAYVARFPKDTKDIVMVTIGAQYSSDKRPSSGSALPNLVKFLEQGSEQHAPKYWEPASVVDNSGILNEVVIAYWHRKHLFDEWSAESGFQSWWEGLDPEKEAHGWFLEIFLPSVDRFETIFASPDGMEGSGYMMGGLSGPIAEHVYFGSMRDRLPISQTDPLTGTKEAYESKHAPGATEVVKKRTHVHGKKNLCIIRSGQDWSQTKPKERKLYLEEMHPVLITGMEFLRDHGEEVGCFSCRFMDVLGHKTLEADVEKTFGYAYFDDIASLEGWSKHHKTHLDIYGTFFKYAQELQGDISLKLFHEVLVLEPKQQVFEYVGCHGKTGMLAGT